MKVVTVDEAQKHLSKLIRLARQGQEVIVMRDSKTGTRLMPIPSETKATRRKPGSLKGKLQVPKDFFDPLPRLRDFDLSYRGTVQDVRLS